MGIRSVGIPCAHPSDWYDDDYDNDDVDEDKDNVYNNNNVEDGDNDGHDQGKVQDNLSHPSWGCELEKLTSWKETRIVIG